MVCTIINDLDRLPLAIKLAASRVSQMSLFDMTQRLSEDKVV